MLSKRFQIVGTSKMRFFPCACAPTYGRTPTSSRFSQNLRSRLKRGKRTAEKPFFRTRETLNLSTKSSSFNAFTKALCGAAAAHPAPPGRPPRALRFPGSPVPSNRNGIQMKKREFCMVFKNK